MTRSPEAPTCIWMRTSHRMNRYAPSISSLHFIPNDNLLTAINDAKQDIAGENNRYSIPGDVIRLGVLAKRGDLSATWFLAFNMRF